MTKPRTFSATVCAGVLVLLFGAYAIVDGVLALYAAVRSGGKHIWAPLLEGIVGIGAGLVAFEAL